MKIVCLGDSLTAGYRLSSEDCWVQILNRETPHTWINAGISGDTSTGLLVRLQTEVLPQQPDMVLLMGGDNDIMLTGCADPYSVKTLRSSMVTGSEEQAKTSLMAMLHQCAARGVKPVVGIPFPIRNIPQRWQAVCDVENARSASLRYIRWLRALTDAISLRRVDFAAAFAAAPLPDELYQEDGMHPSAAGSRVMADAVLQSLAARNM